MKKLFLSTYLILLVFGLNAQKTIVGKWKAQCSVEQADSFTIRFCDICKNDKKGRSNLKPLDLELNFEKNDVTIKQEEYITIKSFEWNESLGTLEFYFKEVLYKFKVLWTNDPKHVILKSQDDTQILLTKK